MKWLWAVVLPLITAALCYILSTKTLLPAPLGRLLSPQEGFWQNAEAADKNFSESLSFPGLKGNTKVYFDERLVPHVFADNSADAYFVQGYLHAKFRLWQMELQTFAAAGRASEIVGEKALTHDREFRRLGMVYAAENSLKMMEADAESKSVCDAYTSGVNAYINSLTSASLPLEYKMIGYQPEQWSNFKTALFLKYMSYDLAGHEDDLEMTNAKRFFSATDFRLLYPDYQDSVDPIIPRGTVFPPPSINPVAPAGADSALDFVYNTTHSQMQPDREIGSNNWAVSGRKTASGSPILCTDPHLGLNLPSIWYEMQITTPEFNTYGVSFPGAPNIIMGFNDSCAFGFTNGGRDVRDYYEIKFKDNSRSEYLYNGSYRKTEFRYEHIKIAGKPDFIDTVAYTVFGPVMYDAAFGDSAKQNKSNYAVRWTAHMPSNELKLFILLDRAKNYNDYVAAAMNMQCPGQNCLFAAKNGDIALRTQGAWPAKWKGQGDFIMPGWDSSYVWQGIIPQNEVPYQYNPERGFVSSANQRPADTNYHYYLGRNYPLYRGLHVNRMLNGMNNITVEDMQKMQANSYDEEAAMILPVMLRNIDSSRFSENELSRFRSLAAWNYEMKADRIEPVWFDLAWSALRSNVYNDELDRVKAKAVFPSESTLTEALLRDSAYKFIDDVTTPQVETLGDIVTKSFRNAFDKYNELSAKESVNWGAYKQTRVYHLTKIPEFSSAVLAANGGRNAINANKMNLMEKKAQGPSWRMVVNLTPQTEAYGVYPGGQSGNPGSRFYQSFVADWTAEKYYKLWVMDPSQSNDQRLIGTMTFNP